jgi:DNA-binding IclR family transcriptional regulator
VDQVRAVALFIREQTLAGNGPVTWEEVAQGVGAGVPVVRRCVHELDELGFVAEGTHGLLWTDAPGELMRSDRR